MNTYPQVSTDTYPQPVVSFGQMLVLTCLWTIAVFWLPLGMLVLWLVK